MTGTRSSAAFYADSLDAFLRASDDEVYAPLTSPHGYTLAPEQLSAWRLQLGKKGTFCFSGRKAECPLFGPGDVFRGDGARPDQGCPLGLVAWPP